VFYALIPQYVINVTPHGHHEPAIRKTLQGSIVTTYTSWYNNQK